MKAILALYFNYFHVLPLPQLISDILLTVQVEVYQCVSRFEC